MSQQLYDHLKADQLAPHSIEAEEAVLGSLLLDPGHLEDILSLSKDDFFIVRHEWVYEAFLALKAENMPMDYLTICNWLEQKGRLAETGGAAYILSLINKTPTALNIEGYATIVKRMATRRRLIDYAQLVARLAHSDDTDMDHIVQGVYDGLNNVMDGYIHSQYVPPVTVGNAAADLLMETARWQGTQPKHGLHTGIFPIDIFLRGLRKRKLYYWCGWPGHGKSAALARIAWALAEQGYRVLFFALEMTAADTVARMVCQYTKIAWNDIEDGKVTGADWDRWVDGCNHIGGLIDGHGIIIDEQQGLTIQEYRNKARTIEQEYGKIDLIILDTLNLVAMEGKTAYDRMTAASHAIKDWAHDHNTTCPICAALHMSRPERSVKNPIPNLHSLRDSGMLEADADCVIGVNRPWEFMTVSEKYTNPIMENVMHWWMLKNRMYGKTGHKANLAWRGPSFAIERLADDVQLPDDPAIPASYTQAGFSDVDSEII